LFRCEALKIPPALGMKLHLAALGAEESCVSLEVEVADVDLVSGGQERVTGDLMAFFVLTDGICKEVVNNAVIVNCKLLGKMSL
jgi:hypothetical protein